MCRGCCQSSLHHGRREHQRQSTSDGCEHGSAYFGLLCGRRIGWRVHGAVRLGTVSGPTCLVFGRIAGQQAASEKPWARFIEASCCGCMFKCGRSGDASPATAIEEICEFIQEETMSPLTHIQKPTALDESVSPTLHALLRLHIHVFSTRAAAAATGKRRIALPAIQEIVPSQGSRANWAGLVMADCSPVMPGAK